MAAAACAAGWSWSSSSGSGRVRRCPGVRAGDNIGNIPSMQQGQRLLRRGGEAPDGGGRGARAAPGGGGLREAWEAGGGQGAGSGRQGGKKCGPGEGGRGAGVKDERAVTEAEQREHAWRRAAAAVELYRPDGRLNDRGGAAAEIAAA